MDKVLFKLGITEYQEPFNWDRYLWGSSLRQMDIDSDIVFLGDSITRGGQWADAFPEVTIINLGISGDTVYGMKSRVDAIAAVKPEKVFICGGINGLTRWNIAIILQQYRNLLEDINKEVSNAELYVQAVLPISKEKETLWGSNETIVRFNSELKKLSTEYGATYIDIHSVYYLDGYMNPYLTKDGIHLKPEAYDLWYDVIRRYIDS